MNCRSAPVPPGLSRSGWSTDRGLRPSQGSLVGDEGLQIGIVQSAQDDVSGCLRQTESCANDDPALAKTGEHHPEKLVVPFLRARHVIAGCRHGAPTEPAARVFDSRLSNAAMFARFAAAPFRCIQGGGSERALQRRRIYVVLRTLAATLGQLGRTEDPVQCSPRWSRSSPSI
jgi:hypothetical protein